MTKRGRPSGTTKSFLSDPDRYSIALIDTLQKAKMSERMACDLVAGIGYGRSVEPSTEAIAKAAKKGLVVQTFQTTTTVDGKASGLRKKAAKAKSAEERHWRSSISGAMFLALFCRGLPLDQISEAIHTLCREAGEPSFGKVLLQMATAPRDVPGDLFSEVFGARNVINGGPTLLPSTEANLAPSRS